MILWCINYVSATISKVDQAFLNFSSALKHVGRPGYEASICLYTRKPGLNSEMNNIMREIISLGSFAFNFHLFDLLWHFRCTGSEYYLADCRKVTGEVAERCGHGRDVAVECTVPKLCDLKDKVYVHAFAFACSYCRSRVVRTTPKALHACTDRSLCNCTDWFLHCNNACT